MNLEKLQQEFTSHIRDPERQPAPAGVEEQRMKIYRDLFFNNIESLLSGNFPVLHKLYDDTSWKTLVREFYAQHRCRTPLFPEIAREFLRYLQDGRENAEKDPPFLLELAHYEWIELALELDERTTDGVAAEPEGDLLDGIPVMTPLVHVLSYRFPVHEIGPDYIPETAPENATHLLVYRNRQDDVKFMLLNDVSRLLVKYLLEDNGRTGRQLLERIADVIAHPDPGRVVSTGGALLEDLRERDIILGARSRH